MNKEAVSNGGPAFPHEEQAAFWDRAGMSMRDYFAAKAMQSLISNPYYRDQGIFKGWAESASNGLAEEAYGIADAMLRAREV